MPQDAVGHFHSCFASGDAMLLDVAMRELELFREPYYGEGPRRTAYVVCDGHVNALMTLVEHGYVVDRSRPYLRLLGPYHRAM